MTKIISKCHKNIFLCSWDIHIKMIILQTGWEKGASSILECAVIIFISCYKYFPLLSFFWIFWETSSSVGFCLQIKNLNQNIAVLSVRKNWIINQSGAWICYKYRSVVVCMFILQSCSYLRNKTLFQVSEEISEEVSVGVLAELIENKPVTKIAVTKNTFAGVEVGVSKTSGFDDDQEVSEMYSKGILLPISIYHLRGLMMMTASLNMRWIQVRMVRLNSQNQSRR